MPFIDIHDDFLPNIDEYVDTKLQQPFTDYADGASIFRNIQAQDGGAVQQKIEHIYGHAYKVALNFIRKSPIGQEEPNYIHSDEMMGDKTVLLYLNREHPNDAGTTLYTDEEEPSCIIKMKYNRLVVFCSHIKHSRNLEYNFGEEENSRLVQILFLKRLSL